MNDPPPSAGQDKFIVRLPEGMRDRIKTVAERNRRSMNAEIVDAIERHLLLMENLLMENTANVIDQSISPAKVADDITAAVKSILARHLDGKA